MLYKLPGEGTNEDITTKYEFCHCFWAHWLIDNVKATIHTKSQNLTFLFHGDFNNNNQKKSNNIINAKKV